MMRLQALVDKKKVIISEATIRDALRLDDAESIDCLPNEEIFTELSRMEYEKPSTKLTFYKAFFSPQWKFLIYTILHCMSAKRTSWNEFRKGFSRVDTPLFEGMIVAQQVDDVTDGGAADVDVDVVPAATDEPSIPPPSPIAAPPSPQQQPQPSHDAKISMDLLHTLLETCRTLTRRVEHLEVGTAQRVDTSEDTVMDDDVAAIEKYVEIEENADVQGRHAESQAQIYQIDIEHADKVLSIKDDELEPAELKEVVEVVTTAKLMTKVVTAASATITAIDTPITATTLTTAPNAARKRKSDEVIEQVQRKKKEANAVMMYQALKRKPQIEAQARKNMMIYLKNMAGFKMDYFKRMSYDDIHPIFEKYFNSNVAFLKKTKEQMKEEDRKALKRASKSQAEKEVKKKNLDEEVEELKKYLQIVPNDEDDVYTEATPLARKQLVKERFASSKPKNFSDDFLLTTLTYMYEKPDVQAQVWKNQRTVHGLAKGRHAESQAQIYQIDLEHADKVLSIKDDELEPAELKEVVEVVTTAKLMTKVVTAASATITAADTPITATTLTTAPNAARKRKRVVTRDSEETNTPSIIIHSEPKSKDKGKWIMVKKPKPLKKQA
uniref:Synaptobrevin, longin-like domain protein n=1 Tax=Tanacetum cinerariifolium TaxID=118510 RepID=A0A699I817_TANCI|nr:hypothetical protein [Tanacetum cinerariifolium]